MQGDTNSPYVQTSPCRNPSPYTHYRCAQRADTCADRRVGSPAHTAHTHAQTHAPPVTHIQQPHVRGPHTRVHGRGNTGAAQERARLPRTRARTGTRGGGRRRKRKGERWHSLPASGGPGRSLSSVRRAGAGGSARPGRQVRAARRGRWGGRGPGRPIELRACTDTPLGPSDRVTRTHLVTSPACTHGHIHAEPRTDPRAKLKEPLHSARLLETAQESPAAAPARYLPVAAARSTCVCSKTRPVSTERRLFHNCWYACSLPAH